MLQKNLFSTFFTDKDFAKKGKESEAAGSDTPKDKSDIDQKASFSAQRERPQRTQEDAKEPTASDGRQPPKPARKFPQIIQSQWVFQNDSVQLPIGKSNLNSEDITKGNNVKVVDSNEEGGIERLGGGAPTAIDKQAKKEKKRTTLPAGRPPRLQSFRSKRILILRTNETKIKIIADARKIRKERKTFPKNFSILSTTLARIEIEKKRQKFPKNISRTILKAARQTLRLKKKFAASVPLHIRHHISTLVVFRKSKHIAKNVSRSIYLPAR